MPSILNLKFKGNKSFVAFSNLNDTESLTKTWKVCTKVASYLEQGQRLENLSWRLWHLQNLMVDTDNAKSKREFKKLSKCMGDKLDKEKGRSIEELEAPDFKRNHSTDMIRQRAVEKERNREASQNATPGTIKRMQFTFSVDQPAQPAPAAPVKKPDTKPSAEFTRRAAKPAPAAAAPSHDDEDAVMSDADTDSHIESSNTASEPATTTTTSSSASTAPASANNFLSSLHFPGLFGNDFGPSALLYAAPTLTTRMNYGEGFNPTTSNDQFSISRPTIELALDDLLFSDDNNSNDGDSQSWFNQLPNSHENTFDSSVVENTEKDDTPASASQTPASATQATAPAAAGQQQDAIMAAPAPPAPQYRVLPAAPAAPPVAAAPAVATPAIAVLHTRKPSVASGIVPRAEDENSHASSDEDIDELSPAPSTARKTSIFKNIPPLSQAVKDVLPETVAPSRLSAASIYGTRSNTPTGRPTLTLRTQAVSTRSSGPSATATSVNPAILRGSSSALNSAPGGVKAECSNCGATHTPLWRRGLNDELNCNACGLYCKLHKRPRPKSMRNSHGGEGRASSQVVPRQEAAAADVMVAAQCYNCHTTATPLWRKDDEGKTVCNACGLYYKLHGSARPISMKSDVIRKRSRHDARRTGVTEDTASASPGVSRRTSPVPEASPTLAPDSTTQMSYEFAEDSEFRSTAASASELMGALGAAADAAQAPLYNGYQLSFPGPYHPEYLLQLYNLPSDALPFSSVDSTDVDLGMSPRSPKRRRMSTDSGDEPPASAVSFGPYSADGGYSSSGASTGSGGGTHSKRSSMEFPFSTYNSNGTLAQGPALRGSGNTFWHPPMMPQSGADNDVPLFHGPAMMPAAGGAGQGAGSGGGSGTGASTPSSTSSGTSSAGSNSGSGSNNEDSPMDYLHPPSLGMQDEESLFSTYLHPPMTLPEDGAKGGASGDEGGGGGGGGGVHSSMFVDSYFQ